MLDKKALEALLDLDAAQTKFLEANDAGYELGIRGGRYVSPYEAVPELCSDKNNTMDRYIAFHYDRGYLKAYGYYLDHHPGAIEDIMFKRMVDKYVLVDKAQELGIIAYEEGRSQTDGINEVYELLPSTANEMNKSIYDGWDFGYLLGMSYDENNKQKIRWPDYDYDRAYALVHASEAVRKAAETAGHKENPYGYNDEEIARIAKEDGYEAPPKAIRAFLHAADILSASEDSDLVECLVCPYHYGCQKGESCDRDCYESAMAIQNMIGDEDDSLREWLRHI